MKKAVFGMILMFVALAFAQDGEETDLGVIDGGHFVRRLGQMLDDGDYVFAREVFAKTEYRVTYLDEQIASYRLVESSYVGGAHGMSTIEVGTLVAGRKGAVPLKLSDIMTDEQRPQVTALIRQALRRHFRVATDAELDARLIGEVKPTENFYYDGAGLHFVYNVYELASYADGTIEVCIPWPRPVCALLVAPVDGVENTP